jgi:hypothetical protein
LLLFISIENNIFFLKTVNGAEINHKWQLKRAIGHDSIVVAGIFTAAGVVGTVAVEDVGTVAVEATVAVGDVEAVVGTVAVVVVEAVVVTLVVAPLTVVMRGLLVGNQ